MASFMFDINDFNDPNAWDLICEGRTKGVFQLESQLGRSWAKRVKPRNIAELAALISLIRPGCLKAYSDGKSMTQHYVDRKNKKEEVTYLHKSLKDILKPTYGVLVYQEQSMRIAQKLAGFDLQEADKLRKAIGKKKADLMAKVKKKFISGCEEVGMVDKETAQEIFSWIEKSQRYSFNKSHSVSYAYNAYLTAYTKAHFPHEFFTSYLKNAVGKPDTYGEIEELVNNARTMNIQVSPPNIRTLNKYFTLIEKNPTFGLTEIKGVGGSVFDKIKTCFLENDIDLSQCDWHTFLIGFGRCIKGDSFEAMILSGAMDCFKISRSRMLHELKMFRELSKREMPWIEDYKKEFSTVDLAGCIKAMIKNNDWKDPKRPIYRKERVDAVESIVASIGDAGYELIDLPGWLAQKEEQFLGVALTCNKVDEYDTSGANCTCKEYIDGFEGKSIRIAAKIDVVREWKIKNGQSKGQMMGFLTISDGTCSLDSVTMFSDEWLRYRKLVEQGNVALFIGSRDTKRGSFLIKSVSKTKNLV